MAHVTPKRLALHPHAPESAHPSAGPEWREMLLNPDMQKLLQAGTSQSLFHELLQVQHHRTGAVFVASPVSSVPVPACTCAGASSALTQAKTCTATATPWGLNPGRARQACSPENTSHEFPKGKNPTHRSSGGASLFIPQLLPKDYSVCTEPTPFQISLVLSSGG